jgi:CBS domain containing-hemolysin-like protein
MTLLLIYAGVALAISFLCSVAEAVLLTVTPSYIASLERSGLHSGPRLRHLKDNVDRPLAAILSLNTIAHTVGAVGVGAQAAIVFGNRYVGLASAVLTVFILILSEIIPKTLGAVYWRALAPAMSVGVRLLMIVLLPLVWLSEAITRLIASKAYASPFRREELAAMVELGAQEGELEVKESRILQNLMRFRTLRVTDIMTPRTVVLCFQEDMSIQDVLSENTDIPFSRIPIYGENQDDVTGFVLRNDILLAESRGRHDAKLHEFRRELRAIPDTGILSSLFDILLHQREHIALAVNEYGGMEGVVTLEDVVETLLGMEIVDEADPAVDMRVLARKRWEEHARRHGLLGREGFEWPDSSGQSEDEPTE